MGMGVGSGPPGDSDNEDTPLLFSCLCIMSSAVFFSKLKKSEVLLECQTVWTHIRTDVLLVLIWV